jgi:hypothetical protein
MLTIQAQRPNQGYFIRCYYFLMFTKKWGLVLIRSMIILSSDDEYQVKIWSFCNKFYISFFFVIIIYRDWQDSEYNMQCFAMGVW